MLFAGLASQFRRLNTIQSKLIRWCSDAVAVGLLPPWFSAATAEAPNKILNSARQKPVKSSLEVLEAKIETYGTISESGARRQPVSPEIVARKLLQQHLEQSQDAVKRHEDLLFPDLARVLKAQAPELLMGIEEIPPWIEDGPAHELAAVGFLMLETLIKDRTLMSGEDNSKFMELCETFNVNEIEGLLSFYRELVPDGEAATENALREFGLDAINAALNKYLTSNNSSFGPAWHLRWRATVGCFVREKLEA